MAMLGHTDLKKDTLIELDGAPQRVLDYSHAAMGRGGAVARVKLKNLLTGAVTEKTFRSADKIPSAQIERQNMQLLYRDGNSLEFMNQTTFEQESVPADIVGNAARFLADGSEVQLQVYNGKVIGAEVPNNVMLAITQTEPGAKGDTATTAMKPALVETGVQVMVPLFINEGDVIKVDTRDGRYLERQK